MRMPTLGRVIDLTSGAHQWPSNVFKATGQRLIRMNVVVHSDDSFHSEYTAPVGQTKAQTTRKTER